MTGSLRNYLARRLLEVIPVVWGVITLLFVLIHLAPGDPVAYIAGRQADPEYIQGLRAAYGLDQPLYIQYVLYFKALATGQLGRSYLYGTSVTSLIANRLPATLLLVLTSFWLALTIGIVLGTISARGQGGIGDSAISLVSIVLYSTPVFWLGLLLILTFGLYLRWLPIAGMADVGARGLDFYLGVLRHSLLPIAALTTVWFGEYSRVTRTSIIEVMKEDFITTAKAVGYNKNIIFFRFGLRNAILPVITLAGIDLGLVIAGAVLTETVFSWPGMGTLVYNAILGRDYPLLMGCYLIISLGVVVTSLLVDILYALLDPRVAYK
jgi:peptide/nickel transport system permease protein